MLSAEDLVGMQRIAPFRNQRLFKEFLPLGYGLTTLSSVQHREGVIGLKVILGTLITLYDDFADRPDRLNPKLLQMLYRVPFETFAINEAFLSPTEKASLDLAESLFGRLMVALEHLGSSFMVELFSFDLKQFFLANLYSELLTQCPELSNGLENRLYLHHNMGIVMAGMIDLMNIPNFQVAELGRARELFLLGQRAGRISNVLTTSERELRENDVTNELVASSADESSMRSELDSIFREMDRYNDIKSFSAVEYRKGVQALHELHVNFRGVI